MMAVSFKGAHFPKDIILMGVRWYGQGKRSEQATCVHTARFEGFTRSKRTTRMS
jgi:hypothetical protein